MSYRDIVALVFTVIAVALFAFGAVALVLAEDRNGKLHRPHWPAHTQPRHRDPRPVQRIYGDVTASLHAAWRAVTRLVGDEEWTAAVNRRPGHKRAEAKR